MPKRVKYPDKFTVGRSNIAPFIAGEDSSQRHARRLQTAEEMDAVLMSWLTQHGFTLELKNNGHHWIMKRPDQGDYIEWWPSSAKLIFDKHWRDGHHCHDVYQVIAIIGKKLGLKDGDSTDPLRRFHEDHPALAQLADATSGDPNAPIQPSHPNESFSNVQRGRDVPAQEPSV